MLTDDVLYQEVENACAYCGQRGKENLSKHHIDHDRSNNNYDNQIILCHNCHHRHTKGKGIPDEDIIELKRRLIKKTLTQPGVNALKMSHRNKAGIMAMPYEVYHLVDLGYMLQKETQMEYEVEEGTIEVTARFTITDTGKRLYEKWLK